MRKVRRKLSFVVAVICFLMVGLMGGDNASAIFYCSSGDTRCEDVTLPQGYMYAGSPYLYFVRGEHAIVDFETGTDSKHHVSFAAYNSNGTRVSDYGYAGYSGGNEDVQFPIPTSGYYYIFVECGGGNTSCSGGGTIRKF